jgi:hypothetical protein
MALRLDVLLEDAVADIVRELAGSPDLYNRIAIRRILERLACDLGCFRTQFITAAFTASDD